MFLTVSLGCLVGVIVVAQTLYTSTTEHLAEFATVKAIGGRDRTIYGVIVEQAAIAACLGYLLGSLATLAAVPLLARIDMPLVVSPELAAAIFAGTLGFCPPRLRVVVPQNLPARPGDGLPGLSDRARGPRSFRGPPGSYTRGAGPRRDCRRSRVGSPRTTDSTSHRR